MRRGILLVLGAGILLSFLLAGRPAAPEAVFGGVPITLFYATEPAVRAQGLSGRATLSPTEGMLFVFPRDDFYGIWMKDMRFAIDIFWLDDKGQVVSIQEEVKPETYPNVFYPTAPARYVLEMFAGFARTHAITLGSTLSLQKLPTVSE